MVVKMWLFCIFTKLLTKVGSVRHGRRVWRNKVDDTLDGLGGEQKHLEGLYKVPAEWEKDLGT